MIVLVGFFAAFSACAKAEVKPALGTTEQLEEKILASVESMANAVGKEGFQLVLDEVKLEDSAVVTPAGRYIRDLITTGAMRTKLFKVLQSKREFLSSTNDRSVEFLSDTDFDGFLQMNYYVEGGNLRLNLRLMRSDTPEMLYAGDTRIATNLLPSSLSFIPQNYGTYRANAVGERTVASNDFQTSLWTDRGKSALYYKGDKMILLAKTDLDCYVKIFYTQVDGEVKLIFPNAWEKNNFLKAGRVCRIPSDAMGFELEMGEPYGIESIRLVAQDAQFEDLAAGDYGDSFRSEGVVKSASLSRDIYTRGVTVKPARGLKPVKHSESITTTTVAER